MGERYDFSSEIRFSQESFNYTDPEFIALRDRIHQSFFDGDPERQSTIDQRMDELDKAVLKAFRNKLDSNKEQGEQ